MMPYNHKRYHNLGKERNIPTNKFYHRITYRCDAAHRPTLKAAERISGLLVRFCPLFTFCKESPGNINSILLIKSLIHGSYKFHYLFFEHTVMFLLPDD
jgi:hypothetical protein